MTDDQVTIDKIVEILRRVPEKKLLIIELANTVPIKYGSFDPDFLSNIKPQINLAEAEAKAYGTHTIQAVAALVQLQGRPAAAGEIRPLEEGDLEAGLQF